MIECLYRCLGGISMKKLFLLVFVSLLVGAATAEVIDSVSFNPARLGRYKNLKISDTLSTIGSAETVLFNADSNESVTLSTYGDIDIGSAKAKTVDMPQANVYSPSVYLMGGALKTKRASLQSGLDFGCDGSVGSGSVGSGSTTGDVGCTIPLWVKAGILEMGSHALKINGKYVPVFNNSADSFGGIRLGGNVIPVPDDFGSGRGCRSLSWYTRYDSATSSNYKVLGCDVGCDVGCDSSQPPSSTKTCKSEKVSERSFTASDPYTYTAKDDCDGIPVEFNGACTSSKVSQGMCTDYYSIGSNGGGSMTGYWYGSYEELSSWPSEYSGYSGCYLNYEKPNNPTDQGNINFASWVKSHSMTPGKASTACSQVYTPAGYGDLGCGFTTSGDTETGIFTYYSQGASCSKSGQTGSYYLKIQLNCTKKNAKHDMKERVWKFWYE